MSSSELRRRLAAILAADVAGYSRMMAADDVATVNALDAGRAVFRVQIEANHGRVIDMAGDSVLAVFETAFGAMSAALAIQQEINGGTTLLPEDRRLRFRIGVHLGDVIEKTDGTVYGDGVNIAARLEGLAEPGGITASDSIRIAVKSKVRASFEDRGEQKVKNISEPVHVFAVHVGGDAALQIVSAEALTPSTVVIARKAPIPRKPKLLLMPFDPLGAGEQITMLTASVTEEMATAFIRVKGIDLVTTLRAADYVAKGSVRIFGTRFRVTVQLLDKSAHSPFWSDRFDDTLDDAFEALDRLAVSWSTALRYQVYQRETDKLKQTPVADQTSQNLMGQAGHILLSSNRASYERSRELIALVLEREADNAMALGIAAWGRAMLEVICGYGTAAAGDGEVGLSQIRRSIELNEQSDFGHLVYGSLLLYCERDISGAILEAERSLQLNPAYVLAMGLMGLARTYSGDTEAGVAYSTKALKGNASFPANHWFMEDLALAHFVREDYAAALDAARRADLLHRDVPRTLLMLTTACWHAGETDDARKTGERLEKFRADFRVGAMSPWIFKDSSHWDRFKRGLIESGLPR